MNYREKLHFLAPSALTAAGITTLGLLFADSAFSQVIEDDEPASSEITEIIVSARKIDENVQDVPMVVDVLTGDFLDRIGLTRPLDLQFQVPGLVVTAFGGGARFALRGVGDEGGSGLAVATHINGIYQPSSALAIQRSFDAARIEVLKGPQGTLYGRNATGGSINFITRLPTNELEGALETAYGSFDTVRSLGHVNIPFTDNFAARFAFSASNGEGYIQNLLDSRKFGEDDHLGYRASFLWQANDRVTVSFTGQHTEDTGGRAEVFLPRPDLLPIPGDIHSTEITLPDPFLTIEADNMNLDVDIELGFATLKSITGSISGSEAQNRDCIAFFPGCNLITLPTDLSAFSQELQLISPGAERFDWIVGLYYFTKEETITSALAFGAPPAPADFGVSRTNEDAYAAFAQASWQFNDHWSLTGGLRYSDEERSLADLVDQLESEVSFDDVGWRVDLEYSPNDTVLLYAGVSEGFKSGGATLQVLPSGEFDTFFPETLLSYEAGIKSDWLDRRMRLNASIFYYDFTDMQVFTSIFDTNSQTFINSVDNAAEAEVTGVDLTLNYQFNDQLSVSSTIGWLSKSEFTEFRNDLGTTFSGNELSRAPELTTSTRLEFRRSAGKHGTISAWLEHNYRGSYFFSAANDPILYQDSFALLNVFLRFEHESERWYLFASARNLTDEQYFQQVGFQSSPGYGDTYEGGFGVRF